MAGSKQIAKTSYVLQQVRCEVIEETSQGASDERCQTICVLKCCMSEAGASLETWDAEDSELSPPFS